MTRFLIFINHMFGVVGVLFQSPLLLILRLYFGIAFMLAGFGKLQDMAKFIDTLISLNVPSPQNAAWAAALSETIGGFLLAIGFLSRIAAVPLIIVMVVAYITVHIEAVYQFIHDPRLFIT